MNRLKILSGMAVLTATLTMTAPAFSHHAFSAEFDANQPIEVTGVVTKVKWTNPHSWIYLDVKGADGTVTNWGFEFGTIAALQRIGLTRDIVPPGSEVTIKGYRSRNGGPFGYSVTTTLADGRTFKLGQPQESSVAAAASRE